MTPGQEALREAARLEAARYYSNVTRPTTEPFSVFAARAEAELQAALERTDATRDLASLIRRGLPTHLIVADYGYTYAEIRAARKNQMKIGAA